MVNLTELNLDSFLRLGYFLDTDYNKNTDFMEKYKKDDGLFDLSETEILDRLEETFFEVIQEKFDGTKKNIVPLSGGLDSRAILGGLLEFTEAKNIQTLTYGSKGTLDFELGNQVAKEFGTSHIAVPLEHQKYKLEELMEISEKVSHQTMLFTHPPLEIMERYFRSSIVWNGFMGDRVMGSHVIHAKDVDDASFKFIETYTIPGSIKLSKNDDKDLIRLLDKPQTKIVNNLTWFEHIDIDNRQRKYIAPHVLMGSYDYITPFINEKWINLIFNLNEGYRKDQKIYLKFMAKSFGRLFSIGVKNNGGAPLEANFSRVKYQKYKNRLKLILSNYIPSVFNNPYTNYINFSREIITNASLLSLIKELLTDLKHRDMVYWLDLDKILREHLTKKVDHSMAIIILCSLEIHLKAKKYEI